MLGQGQTYNHIFAPVDTNKKTIRFNIMIQLVLIMEVFNPRDVLVSDKKCSFTRELTVVIGRAIL